MKTKDDAKIIAVNVILAIAGVISIICIGISMRTGETTPYLAIALALSGLSNLLGCLIRQRMRGKEDGSC